MNGKADTSPLISVFPLLMSVPQAQLLLSCLLARCFYYSSCLLFCVRKSESIEDCRQPDIHSSFCQLISRSGKIDIDKVLTRNNFSPLHEAQLPGFVQSREERNSSSSVTIVGRVREDLKKIFIQRWVLLGSILPAIGDTLTQIESKRLVAFNGFRSLQSSHKQLFQYL